MGRLSWTVAVLVLVGSCGGLVAGAAGAPPRTLGVALIAPQSAPALEARWAPLLAALSQATGHPVEAHLFPDYAGAVWSMRDDRSQIGWFGNKSAIEAVDFAGGEVFARRVELDGEEGYHSYLVVRQGGPLRTVAEVQHQASNLTLAMGNPNSTSGAVVPRHYLFGPLRMDPRSAFKRVVVGSHEDNWLAVAEGQVDLATVASVTFNRLCQDRPTVCARLSVLWRSPLIPSDPLVWRKTLPDELKAKIRGFFAAYGRPAPGKTAARLRREQAILRDVDAVAFAASDNGQLQAIRDIEAARQRLAQADKASPAFEVRLDALSTDAAAP